VKHPLRIDVSGIDVGNFKLVSRVRDPAASRPRFPDVHRTSVSILGKNLVSSAKAASTSRARVETASRAHDIPSAYVNGQARLVAQRDGVIATVSTFDVAQRGKWCWTDSAVTVPPDPAASRGRARSAAKAGIPRQPRDRAGGRRSTARRTGDFADA